MTEFAHKMLDESRSTESSRTLLRRVLDDGSFRSWDGELPAPPGPVDTPEYRAALARARERSGSDESVHTGEGRLDGRRVAVLCSEFAFLGGSVGASAAERLLIAIERATQQRLPLFAITASGGTRMQEGTLAFLRMTAIASALTRHKASGLPYVVYLRNPTAGGVLASWGSLGHVSIAEPGALIGFLGPKVYQALHGEPFPSGVQQAENLHRHGLIDAVVPPHELGPFLRRVLVGLTGFDRAAALHRPEDPAATREYVGSDLDAWSTITSTRRADRPGLYAVLDLAGCDVVPLAGTGGDDRALLLALARFGAVSCVLIGQPHTVPGVALGPEEIRIARHGMRLAGELDLPVVTVIDTPGAALSVPAEEGGLAGELARCLAELSVLPVATLSVLLGQGSGAGALALLPTDRVIAARHGWLTALPPEGASTIMHGTPSRAAEVAAAHQVRSVDLLRAGAVDLIVDELPDAADEPGPFARRLVDAVRAELSTLLEQSTEDRLTARRRRYRNLGRTV